MTDGRTTPGWSSTTLVALIALVLAVGSLFLPAAGALAVSGGSVVLGLLGRRRLKRDPGAGPAWVPLAAVVLGGFVFVSQAVFLAVVFVAR